MREFPVFVPFGDEHLSAVVCLPDGEPSGLLVLMTGLGSPRSHRYAVWTRVARRVAERGVASIRADYVGLGDSSGMPAVHRYDAPLWEQPIAAARFLMRAVPGRPVVMMGNCWGASITLTAAETLPECVGAVAVRAGPPTRVPAPGAGAGGGSRLRATVRRVPLLRRAVARRRARRAVAVRSGPLRPERLRPFLERGGRVLFVSADEDKRYRNELRPYLTTVLPTFPPELVARTASAVVPGRTLEGFESIDIQDRVIDLVSQWIPGCFATAEAPSAGYRR